MRLLTPTLILTLLAVAAVSTASRAQVYRSLDSDGAVSFSDRPTPDAMELDVPLRSPVNEQAPAEAAQLDGDLADPGPYDDFEIVAPEDEYRSREPDGQLQVSMLISPALMDGHRLQLEVDDAPLDGDLPNPAQVMLRGLSLGTHRIRAVIRDTENALVANTRTLSVHVLPPQPETDSAAGETRPEAD